MRSGVFLTACIPAITAVCMMLPFGPRKSFSARESNTSGGKCTLPEAMAVLAVDFFEETSMALRRLTAAYKKVPEPHEVKNRVHIDLDVTDLDAAVSRVQELGGNKLRQLNEYGIKWAVMADPDGNEFCLVQHSK